MICDDVAGVEECNGWSTVNLIGEDKPLGIKFDQGKLDWLQIPWCQLEKVIEVSNYGGEKYSPNNWMYVDKERYIRAMIRHLVAHIKGEKYDDESGMEHLAHMVASTLFYMWHQDNEKGEE